MPTAPLGPFAPIPRYEPGYSPFAPTLPPGTGTGVDWWKVGSGLCELLPNETLRAICRGIGGGAGYDPKGEGYTKPLASCPTGYAIGKTGICEKTGAGGFFERVLPGGETGTLGPGGTAVLGLYGAGIMPAQVGSITRNDGTVMPLLRCPAGHVLGKDSICYDRGAISRRQRKHPPARKPLLTGGDMSALTRVNRIKGKLKTGARSAGLYVADRKPTSPCKKRKR